MQAKQKQFVRNKKQTGTIDVKHAQEVKECERGRPPVANTPPFSSMAELMEGELKYVVAVPDVPDAALTVQVQYS